MALRDVILASPETLSDLKWAAEQRFREGEALLMAGRFSGAVYLLGLASEMWLKIACFRARGAGPATTVDSQLAPAKAWMKAQWPMVQPAAYHSLLFWVEYLVRVRQSQGRALPAVVAGAARHHVLSRLYRDWKIDLRYRAVTIDQKAAWRVYLDTIWVRQASGFLWR
jgi:hypothetical protein